MTLSQGAKISNRWVRASSEIVAADLPQSLQARVGMPAETGYDLYLSYPFQFIKRYKICALIYELGKEVLLSSGVLTKNVNIKIHRAIITDVVLYGCETWSLTI